LQKKGRILMLPRGVLAIAVLITGCGGLLHWASAETFVEHSAAAPMQLDLVVADAALRKMLPEGWEPVVAKAGAAKDCNVRMIFMDRVDITGKDGAAGGHNKKGQLRATY